MREKSELLERGEHTWSEDSVRLIVTPSHTARSIYFYTQEAGYFKTFYPYFSERKNLDSFLIVCTISGTGHLKYQGGEYILKEGQCFMINCEQHHLYETRKDDDWEFLWVHFNGSSSLGYYNEFVRNGFRIITCQNQSFMEQTIRRIITLHQQRDLTTELITSNLINSLLTELLLQTSTNNVDTFLIPDYIREIAREIDKNFKEELTLAHFEAQVHRSRYHILKEFKKYMGITIHEYLISTRLSYAKELLKYTDYPVQEITFETGMNNVTHFINLFKDREGMTPLVYRKAWRG